MKRMKRMRGTFALILAAVTCISMLPVQVYASEADAGVYRIAEEEGNVSGEEQTGAESTAETVTEAVEADNDIVYGETDEWYYGIDGTNVILYQYIGPVTGVLDIVVPATLTIDGQTYNTILEGVHSNARPRDNDYERYTFPNYGGTLNSIYIESGVKAAEDVSYLFRSRDTYSGSAVTINAKGLDVSGVKNMQGMFDGNTMLETLDISGWDVSNVTDISYMFRENGSTVADGISIDLTGLKFLSVTDATEAFARVKANTIKGIDKLGFGKLENITQMFNRFISANELDVSGWDVSKVTEGYGAFRDTEVPTLKLRNWKLTSLKNCEIMFSDVRCTYLDMGGVDGSNFKQSKSMFDESGAIVTFIVPMNVKEPVDLAGGYTYYDSKGVGFTTLPLNQKKNNVTLQRDTVPVGTTPADSGDSTDPDDPTDPTTPMNPTEPVNPTTPTDLTEPEEPANPTDKYETGDIILVKGQKINIYDRLIKEMEANGLDPNTKGGKFTLEETKTKPIALTDKGLLTARNKGNCYIYWSTPNNHGKLTRRYRFDFDVKVCEYTVKNKTLTLTYSGQTVDGSDAIFCDVDPTEWKSANTKVATIGQSSGRITAVSKGSSKITAIWKTDLGQVSASFTLKVNTPVLNKTEVTIPTGSSFTLTVKNVPKESDFYWEPGENNGTITPDVKGSSVVLKALKPGENTYTAMVDEVPYTCHITVPEPSAKKSPITLNEKKSASISLINTKYKPTAFEWRSTNPSVATVNNKGKVTAVKRGYATIVGTIEDNVRVSVPVTVNCPKKDDLSIPVDPTKGISKTPILASAAGDTVIGDDASGITMTVPSGTFTKDTQIEAKPLDQKQLKKIGAYRTGVFEEIIDPVEISIEGYEKSGFFGTDMMLTIPVEQMSEDNMSSYVFAYYDEKSKTVRYLYPDRYDLDKSEISIELPHCSKWWGAKLTREEEIDAFLNTYSTQKAVEQGMYAKSAAELEPYIRAKAEALGLRKEAAKDLIQATINCLATHIGGKYEEGGAPLKGAAIELGTKSATGVTRALADGDTMTAVNTFEDVMCGAMQKAWNNLKFSERPANVFTQEVINPTASQAIGNMANVIKMVYNLKEGKNEEAKKDLSNILQSIHPAAEMTTKGTAFVASCVNVEFTYWKANKVEELYQVYRNGNWYVSAGNKEEFLEYLNYSSGLCWSKGINRFYQMDKMEEMWKEIRLRDKNWEQYESYYDLPESEQNKLQSQAEAKLMEYFELRRSQESEAAKIKAREQVIVSTMLKNYTGALAANNTDAREFFGEESDKDYNVTRRLERLVNVRTFISKYVNEDNLERYSSDEGGFNYGDLMNTWVELATGNRLWDSADNKEKTINEFCQYLESNNLLNEGYNTKYEGFSFDERTIGYASCSVEWSIFETGQAVFEKEGEWYEITVPGRQDIPINAKGTSELIAPKLALAKVDTAGNFSVNNGPLTMQGTFDAKMKTGSGTFTYRASASMYYYSASDLQNYIRSNGNMTGFNGFEQDFSLFSNFLTDCDTETEVTGTFTIYPSRNSLQEVIFKLNGTGTVTYSGNAISSIYDYNDWFKKNPDTEVSEAPIYGVKQVNFQETSHAKLVPKSKDK